MSKPDPQRALYLRLLGLDTPRTPVSELLGSELLLVYHLAYGRGGALAMASPQSTTTFTFRDGEQMEVPGARVIARLREVLEEFDVRLAPRKDSTT